MDTDELYDDLEELDTEYFQLNRRETDLEISDSSIDFSVDVEVNDDDPEDFLYTLGNDQDYVDEAAQVFETVIENTGVEEPLAEFWMEFESDPGDTETAYKVTGEDLRDYMDEGLEPAEIYRMTVQENTTRHFYT